jgi:hypothetical protein
VEPTPAPPRAAANHLGRAIVGIVLFWPLGIPAVANAIKVDPLSASGDHAGAARAAEAARVWSLRATIVGVVWLALSGVCVPLVASAIVDPVDTAAWVRAHL